MHGAHHFSPPIESRDDLIEVLARGSKPKERWRIGTEHEKHVFHTNPLRPVTYDGPDGIHALLAGVAEKTGWAPIMDRDVIIGLQGPSGQGAISLEPGGQFELSGAPVADLHETARETLEHLALTKAIGGPLDIHFLGLGVTPLWSVKDIPAMPKSRYGIMTPYMDKVGTLGTSMMYRSATVQTNLDFSDEADMVKKLRVSLALQPVATALFANSPFVDGKDSGYLSFRSHIWLNTDNARTGMLPFAFDPGMGFERYVDHALDVPMYFVIRNHRYIDVSGESFRSFLEGKLPQLPGEKPTIEDWEDHLSTLFPEVRLKQFLEMRGADMGSADSITALAAFWVGLLYDGAALDAAWDLVKSWTAEERQQMRNEVPRTALSTPFRKGTVYDVAREALAISTAGLTNRGRLSDGHSEAIHLASLEQTLQLRKTPAERWLDLYRGEWAGDLTRIFAAAEL
ncbi:MAG TPA: glutamate--cysteine ligase [Devosiaceae bacterium]|nr:glutamate--cysteine ligase [Devosiaceae bacterium]